jgi:hypothetical protein
MGMFDDIRCEYPLPLPENQGELAGRNWREEQFQTKDFDCVMTEYCVREDGTLWDRTYAWETTRKGWPRRKPEGWERVSSFTGTVRFYNSIYARNADYSVEWVAVFVSGRVTELKPGRWEEQDNSGRLATEAKWKSERDKRDRFLATWFGRRVYPPYAWVVHGCFGTPRYRIGQRIGSLCRRVGIWLDRVSDKLAPFGDPIRAKQRAREFSSSFDNKEEG